MDRRTDLADGREEREREMGERAVGRKDEQRDEKRKGGRLRIVILSRSARE